MLLGGEHLSIYKGSPGIPGLPDMLIPVILCCGR